MEILRLFLQPRLIDQIGSSPAVSMKITQIDNEKMSTHYHVNIRRGKGLEWLYLRKKASRLGFSTSFIDWVKTSHCKPQAKILTNGMLSAPLTLQRSSGQGRPLSTSLFVPATEPLAQAVRQVPGIKGIRPPSTHKISLFADHVISFLPGPADPLPRYKLC